MANFNTRRAFRQQDPNKGNFQAYKSLRKGEKAPAFTGRITLPGSSEDRAFSLWGATSKKNGSLILSGPVTPSREKQWDRVAGNAPEEEPRLIAMQDGTPPFSVATNHMVLFTNPNRDVSEGKKAPPKMFGYYNPGGNEPTVVISAFEHADRNNNIMLLGPVETYDPNRSFEKQIAREQEEDLGNDEPEVPAHLMAQKTSGRHRTSDDGPMR